MGFDEEFAKRYPTANGVKLPELLRKYGGVIEKEAADRIEQLEAELADAIGLASDRMMQADDEILNRIEKLEAALREIAEKNSVQAGPDKDMYRRWRYVATNAIDIARNALEGKDD